jgi:hypothetical protein
MVLSGLAYIENGDIKVGISVCKIDVSLLSGEPCLK